MVMVVCGETGVGKTYRNKAEIRQYLQGRNKAQAGRKVLAFDTNDDDYTEFPTVNPAYLSRLRAISPRRIRPFLEDGSPMSNEDKREVIQQILAQYRSGMIVLDDIDHYMMGARGQSMIGALCTVRHKGIDILLTHQSIAKISTSEWQNCTWLRLHHQVDDVTRYRDRIPRYKLVRIAQLIVDAQYDHVCRAYEAGQLAEQDYKKHKSFFVYVNMRDQKVSGCSKAAFLKAAKRYIDQEEQRLVNMLLGETDLDGNRLYKSKGDVVLKLLADYLRFWQRAEAKD